MATGTGRLLAALFGGGSAVLGIAITYCYTGLAKQRGQKKVLVDQVFCETSHVNEQQLGKKDGESSHVPVHDVPHNLLLLKQARSLIRRVKEEKGCPGLAISVSLHGKTVWSEGFGYSDVENGVKCKPTTVMRIASISKSLTATAAMKLLEEGKLNLDDPIENYVPSFPQKQVNSKASIITVRHLLSHLAGIRHYYENNETNNKQSSDLKDEQKTDVKADPKSEFDRPDYYIKECYDSVEKSMSLFKNDPLVGEPGSKYLYTTFGYTLLSAVIASASKQEFLKHMEGLFEKLGLTQTQADLHKKLIYGRARFYVRDSKGRLTNTPYVDNCYKLAGGGFLSTTEDLIKFGNAMLYSSQVGNYQKVSKSALLPGILSPESMSLSWEIVQKTEDKVCKKGGYGLGWMIFPNKHEHGCCRDQPKAIFHTGGAVGSSSVLFILPSSAENTEQHSFQVPPKGVVVAILVNMQNVQLLQTALEIAELFKNFTDT